MEIESKLKNVFEEIFIEKSSYVFTTDSDKNTFDKIFKRCQKSEDKNEVEEIFIDTPIEKVFLGENQYSKFAKNKFQDSTRKYQMGMAYLTLTDPMIILEEHREGYKNPSHLYVRSFISNDYKTMLNIVIYQFENSKPLMVSVSSHFNDLDYFTKKLNGENKILYIEESFLNSIKEKDEKIYDFVVKNNNSISHYLNKDYDKSKLLTKKELQSFRNRDKEIEREMRENEEGKEKFNRLLEEHFVKNNNLEFFNVNDMLLEFDKEVKFGAGDPWDIADFCILHKTFANSLFEMKEDMEKAFNRDLDIDEFEICDYYTNFVIEYVNETIKDYKKKCSKNSKYINKKLKDLNYIFDIDKKGYFSK